ncbi:hypothetical protein GE21DRAFT_8411 [Neurospora crassa]|uniref:DUF7708 domain-containing protein n=1 Tax=Neurospora crassa (strain ATCC 24698 / 74-OR23-1A / CBS 708.71 / DSM 1257 / FGSC 987) TaxID=367110 RepID=Q7S1A8_NEUCR|nr:hypothetical protein NCU09857 [Neurospora crassa OR74A]EAA29145.2 hypothetical protein NCU09857 [Neurospora crassa OR74A]KHE82029.1 hypothetical protein GE21DRAFT_8411 [Neurospora crassa]|eukprot:XP_958381.2 hypothetical protein NCU09857 [Neurospora crassa OR74A]
MDHRDLTPVLQYLAAGQAGKFDDSWANPDPATLERAESLYIAHHGRLPSPALVVPKQLEPSEKFRVYVVNFTECMHHFLEVSGDKSATEAFSCKSWDGVEDEVAKAMEAVEGHDKRRRSWRKPFEAADRLGGITARRIEFLVQLIPDGEYTGLLAGGLRLLCNTAKRKKEVRETILQMLDSLGDTVSHSKAQIRLYSDDPDLKEKSEDLYMAILDFVAYVVSYLNRSSAIESFKAFFQQTDYGSKLDDAVDKVKKASASFEGSVSICFQTRVEIIDKNVRALVSPIMALYFTLGGLVRDFPTQMEQLVRKEMQNAAMFQPTMHFIQFVGPMQPQMPPPGFNASQLWPLLCTNWNGGSPTVAEDLLANSKADVQLALRLPPSSRGQNQIGYLLIEDAFVVWLKSLESQILVLHDEQSLEGTSSSLSTLSYLCALITEMMSAPGMVRLCFFCGLHSADGDVLGGGYGLMRSLALQLLQPFGGNANLSTTGCDLNLLGQGLMMNDLSTACSVFNMLLHNVPVGVVYILVDGAFWYASGSHGDEMAAVMAFLNRLVIESRANANRGLVLKILVTNPTPSQRNSWDIQAAVVHLEQSLFEDSHEVDVQRMIAGF